ncbi:polyprenyl synthetase family protein [Sanguibacter antarcticus]|uniref:Geranylgeranyl diphosphate synthase type II n=1 Tax=Sanguibacter antarcticus TaxID=372484 RepID=A0A2A9E321_9MICO|nr:polyprenyl synthetase family protein [Sanguibacter antarcticus]PFG32755.1 geranylgeranyl diphosphate synthase type II [Sanguibacter antarcticus]
MSAPTTTGTARSRRPGRSATPAYAFDAMTVDSALDAFFDQGIARSEAYGPDYEALWLSLRDATRGGKRFRPALVIGMYELLGGLDHELVCTVAAAIELLHSAFVIHDDVIDHDDVRRGRPNVSGTFAGRARATGADADRARNVGHAAGILAGDLALTGAARMISLSTAAPDVKVALLDLLDHAIFATAAGELSDVQLSAGPGHVDLSEILAMEAHKTAVYSFELPLQAGAILAGADPRTIEWLSHFGRQVGIAFQLLDDIQGVFGDARVTGKSVLTDLREGKMTPIIAHARSTTAWETIRPVLGDPDVTEEQAVGVRRALELSGTRMSIEKLADEYLESAFGLVNQLRLPPTFPGWFTSITHTFIREHHEPV